MTARAVSAQDSPPAVRRGPVGRRLSLRPVWGLVAVLVLLAGTTGSWFAATASADRAESRNRTAFATSAAQVASTLQLAIQHEEDLIYSAAGFLADKPTASTHDLTRWEISVHALERYPELLGIFEAVIVPERQLPAFVERTTPEGSFTLSPAGSRPFYCLSSSSFARTGGFVPGAEPGNDLCAASGRTALLASRDSGQGAYIPFGSGPTSVLVVLTPVYKFGVPPATTAGRQAMFLGWVGIQVVPDVLLQRALAGHPNFAVTFTFGAAAAPAVFASGSTAGQRQAKTTDLHNGWTVRTTASNPPTGVLANSTALTVLIAGTAVSALLAALLFVLATGRARALRLVTEKTDELRHRALHDALTGLPNRALILDRIEHLLIGNARSERAVAALYVDLDGFKNVNDTFGHGAGDRLLEAVAARFTASLRGADTIGRMSGDEFVVLLDDAGSSDAPEIVAERLLDAVRPPFLLEGVGVPVLITASVGIAVGCAEVPEELLRQADVALYQAKAAGRNGFVVFRAEMGSAVHHRHELQFDLRAALDGDQFLLYYQPVYNLEDLSLIGVEALLRWEHPVRGRIQPDEFIPLLEASGQIVDVGRWVLREACRQMAAWREEGNILTVSVNVAGPQLDRDVIVDDVRDALDLSGIDPSALIIEVTETALMNNVDATAQRLRELKTMGVSVSIDDFGTGYSSLAYLQRFPVDCLKIDRSFTDGITRSAASQALVRTLVQLGKDLELKTLAEGVETSAQLDYLRGQKVDEIQGFLLARPLAPADLEIQILHPSRATSQRKQAMAAIGRRN